MLAAAAVARCILMCARENRSRRLCYAMLIAPQSVCGLMGVGMVVNSAI